MKLTDKEYMLLSQMAYQNIDKNNLKNLQDKSLCKIAEIMISADANIPLSEKEKCKYIIPSNGGLSKDQILELLEEIKNDSNLSKLRLKAVTNNNEGKNGKNDEGFKALAFYDEDSNDTYFAFTGSEGASGKGFRDEDWINDFSMIINQDKGQLNEASDFVKEYKNSNGNCYVTGHSLGGANAMYAAASIDGVSGVVFDGPGISQLLTPEEKEWLKNSLLINYTAENDPIGSVGDHSENHIFAKQKDYFEIGDEKGNTINTKSSELSQSGLFAGHYTSALMFSEAGNIIPGEQGDLSIFFQWFYKNAYEDITEGDTVLEDILNVFIKIENENNNEDYKYNPTALCDIYDNLTKDGMGGLKKATSHILEDMSSGLKNSISTFKTDISAIINNGTENIKKELNECKDNAENISKAVDNYFTNIKKSVGILEKYTCSFAAGAVSIERGMSKICADLVIHKYPDKTSMEGIIDVFNGFSESNKIKVGTAANEILNIFKQSLLLSKDVVTEEINAFNNVLDIKSKFDETLSNLLGEPRKIMNKVLNEMNENLQMRKREFLKGIGGFISFGFKSYAYFKSPSVNQFAGLVKSAVPSFLISEKNYSNEVNLNCLNDLSKKLKAFETNFGDNIANLINEVNKMARDISSSYSENAVQRELQELYQIIYQVRTSAEQFCDGLDRQNMGLKNAMSSYQTQSGNC